MNFTHLMPNEKQPPQALLQRYEKYLVIVVLSDGMKRFIMDTAKFDFESSDDTLCQLIFPEHLELASAGSMLAYFRQQLVENRRVPNTNHSFIAASTRTELLHHPTAGGQYYPLMLNTITSEDKMIALLKQTIAAALHRTALEQTSERLAKSLRTFGPAASFVASVYRLTHGLP